MIAKVISQRLQIQSTWRRKEQIHQKRSALHRPKRNHQVVAFGSFIKVNVLEVVIIVSSMVPRYLGPEKKETKKERPKQGRINPIELLSILFEDQERRVLELVLEGKT